VPRGRRAEPPGACRKQLVEFLEKGWTEPDDGIWEVRGPRRHFTHSKVMAWVAVDRAVRTLEEWPDLDGPLEAWRKLRDDIFSEVCAKGYNKDVGAFTQYYGSDQLDASVLMIPLVGFLPPGDPRVVSTVEAVQRSSWTMASCSATARATTEPWTA
jgi:GH15 family glucan-1,4-alpha-glucosidase